MLSSRVSTCLLSITPLLVTPLLVTHMLAQNSANPGGGI